MRSILGKWLWGLCFLAAGVLLILNQLDLLNFSLFFPGWWTLFILVPCSISIVQIGFNIGNGIGLGVGTILLLQYYVPAITPAWIGPVVLIVIGLGILFKRPFRNRDWKPPVHTAPDCKSQNVRPDVSAIFSGQNVRPAGEPYGGGTLTAIFGGIELDLRGALLEENVYIDATSIFGGIQLYLPENCKLVTDGTHLFGGLSNKHINPAAADVPAVHLNATCIFGGAEVF